MGDFERTVREFKRTLTGGRQKTAPLDIMGKVTRVEDGVAWVRFAGSEIGDTPVRMNMDCKEGDDVQVRSSGGKAWIVGNQSAPPTDDTTATYAQKQVVELNNSFIENSNIVNAEIVNLKAKDSELDQAIVIQSNIVKSEIYNSQIEDFTVINGVVQGLKATDAEISGKITAAEADIGNLKANKADISELEANYAHITNGVIDNAKIGYADVNDLNVHYANIDLANVNNAWIQNGVIKDAAITDAQIIGVGANKITAGVIDASKITVTNLNADNITAGTINGQRIGTGSLSLDKLAEEVPTKEYLDDLADNLQGQIDGQIETWTGTTVPTLNNAPAVDWKGDAKKLKAHVGDIYYVVNAANDADGYTYRFTESGSGSSATYSWTLIKDNQITKALQEIQEAKGDISGIKQFDSEISSWKTETDEELSSLKGRTTTLETDMGTKVSTQTFNELSQTVDENTASITSLSDVVDTKADGSTVQTLSNTVNTVKQTADTNKSNITNLTKKVDDNETDIEQKYSDLTQDLSGFKTTVGSTYHKISDFNTYKTANDAAVAAAKKAGDDAQADLDDYKDTVEETYATKSALTQTESSIKQEVSSTYTTQTTFNNYKSSNDTAVAAAKKAGTDAQSDLDSYKTTNDAAVQSAASDASTAKSDAATAKTNASNAISTANTAKSTADTAKSTADTAKSTADTAKSDAATAKTNAASAVSTANTAKSTADTAKSTADAAKDAIDNLEIGGRNLLRFTDWNPDSVSKFVTGGVITFDNWSKEVSAGLDIQEDGLYHIYSKASNESKFGVFQDIVLEANTNYVLSAKVGESYWIGIGAKGSWPVKEGTWNETGNRVWRLFNTGSTTERRIYIYGIGSNNTESFVNYIKLEKGNKPTDWTPAPEDLEAATDAVASELETVKTTYVKNSTFETTTEQIRGEVSNVETTTKSYTDGKISQEVTDRNSAINQKADAITASVSSTYATKDSLESAKAEIKVTTDSISTKVAKKTDKASIISTIRQSAESVKIKASQVEIDGATTFNAIKDKADAAYDAKGAASDAVGDLVDDLESASGTTVINGGHIATNSIGANKIKVNELTIGQSQVDGLSTALEGKQPTGDYATKSQAQGYASTAETNSKSYADTKKTEAVNAAATDATTKANNAKDAAISTAATDATNKANAAEANAKKVATNYIYAGSDDIKIANADPEHADTYQKQTADSTEFYVDGVKRSDISGNGMRVYDSDGSTEVAKFKRDVTIGSLTDYHTNISPGIFNINGGANNQYVDLFSVSKSENPTTETYLERESVNAKSYTLSKTPDQYIVYVDIVEYQRHDSDVLTIDFVPGTEDSFDTGSSIVTYDGDKTFSCELSDDPGDVVDCTIDAILYYTTKNNVDLGNFTFGTRYSGGDVGNGSATLGKNLTAATHYQTVIGRNNSEVVGPFVIGNGQSSRGNALAVGWNGDLKLNGDVYINCNADSSGGKKIGENKLLWSGAWLMDAGQTARLSEKVSEQLTGIVLVWSYYTNDAAQNYGWNTFFVPKGMVELKNGVGYDIPLRRTKNAAFGIKYVYVNDNRIVGHADNVATGTANNVPYANNKWVLRYVFGC